MKNLKLYIVFSILIAIFAASLVYIEFENDTFFTIPIGNYILENGITEEEQFTWHEGLKFTNSRWLFDIIIANIYNLSSFKGIYIFVMIISAIIGLTLFNILIKRKNNILISFFTTITALYFAKDGLSGRAQIVSYLMFIIEIYLIERLLETNKKRYCFGLLGVSVIIANFHASVWPMYFVFYMPYFAEYIIRKFRKGTYNGKIITEKFEIKLLLVTFIISIFSGLCTPIGLAPYTDMIKVMLGKSKNLIGELGPVAIIENIGMFISLVFYIMIINFPNAKIKVSDFCMIIGLYLIGLMAFRNTFFLYLIASICSARIVSSVIIPDEIENVTNKLNKNSYISLFSIAILVLTLINYSENIGKSYINDKYICPVGAADYILENIDIENMRIYNHFNMGGYLEFKKIPVFIDSRSGIYCEEFNNTSLLEDFMDVAYGKVNYRAIFEKYDITHVLLYKDEIINTYIPEDKDYKLLYEDENFILYEKI